MGMESRVATEASGGGAGSGWWEGRQHSNR